MCKCKIEKSGRGRPGRRGGFGNSDTPGQGEGGWFENPRFWRTSFVDGPLEGSDGLNNHVIKSGAF